jgi:hypothetical protein
MPKLRVSRAKICAKVAEKFKRTSKTVKLQLVNTEAFYRMSASFTNFMPEIRSF